eukprot:CAMPEP_0203826470 /NCGR_PEP_ID=MMETSP0115-20131106/56694_1 /ASSEMBLY_ACC=CAM_ASM_000227 /TAXON_ID=33651 /ORGANISM="Bicosoecid sp, Strain ms1" /LENGTH=420 /DNA_ID=CAMNT_0050735517 /DNA_START=51 /DNA_END=1309 /DNA_ORIENTATION=+
MSDEQAAAREDGSGDDAAAAAPAADAGLTAEEEEEFKDAPICKVATVALKALQAGAPVDLDAIYNAAGDPERPSLSAVDRARAAECILCLPAGFPADPHNVGAAAHIGRLCMAAGCVLERGGELSGQGVEYALLVLRKWCETGARRFSPAHEEFFQSCAPFVSTVVGRTGDAQRQQLLGGVADYFWEAVDVVRWRSGPAKWVHMVLTMQFAEPLLVLHPGKRRGYRVVISGIADCFQLETLLQDTLIGDEADRMLPGAKPPAAAVAVALGQGAQDGPGSCHGVWDMMQAASLRADGTVPNTNAWPARSREQEQLKVWHEGTPSDIRRVDSVRTMLLTEPAYGTTWPNNRCFDSIAASCELAEVLTDEAFDAAMARVAEVAADDRAAREALAVAEAADAAEEVAEAAARAAMAAGGGGGGG